MGVTFRNYDPRPFFTDDYREVREFLARVNAQKLYMPRFLWGAWEWAVTHGGRDQDNLGKIGLWEDGGKLVAIAAYECPLGEGFLIVDEDYAWLKPDLVDYAQEHLHDNGKLRLLLPDGDDALQALGQVRPDGVHHGRGGLALAVGLQKGHAAGKAQVLYVFFIEGFVGEDKIPLPQILAPGKLPKGIGEGQIGVHLEFQHVNSS